MLTWLLIAVLILFGFGEGIFWAHSSIERACYQKNFELLERHALGPLRHCGTDERRNDDGTER